LSVEVVRERNKDQRFERNALIVIIILIISVTHLLKIDKFGFIPRFINFQAIYIDNRRRIGFRKASD